MSLVDVRFQPHARRLLQSALARDRVPHAYIFFGPDGVGKEMAAKGLAQVLLCPQPTEREVDADDSNGDEDQAIRCGCGACEDCRLTLHLTHPDLHIVSRQLSREHPDPQVRKKKSLAISVDVLRHFLIDKTRLTSARGQAKVFIVREAQLMSDGAQNALLKTLEEPPPKTFLILLMASMGRTLATTLSRCQMIRFNTLPSAFVADKLRELRSNLTASDIPWYAHRAGGSIGQALEWIDDGVLQSNTTLTASMAELLNARGGDVMAVWMAQAKALGAGYRTRDPEITDTEASRRGLKTVMRLTADWYADLLHCHCDLPFTDAQQESHASIQRAATRISTRAAGESIRRIARAERQLDLNVNTQLCIETLIADLARTAKSGVSSAA